MISPEVWLILALWLVGWIAALFLVGRWLWRRLFPGHERAPVGDGHDQAPFPQ